MSTQKTKAELEEEFYRICHSKVPEDIWNWVFENCELKAIQVQAKVKPACETIRIIEEMLREADILKEHKDYVYNLDNAERLRGYKLALQRLREKIMSRSV